MVDIDCVYILISKDEKKGKSRGLLVDLNVKVIFLEEGFLLRDIFIGAGGIEASVDGEAGSKHRKPRRGGELQAGIYSL